MREAAPGVTAWLSSDRATAVLAWDNATVPEASARVTVRAAVGLVAEMVVSEPSAEEPSNTRALLAPQTELAALTLLVDSVEVKTVAEVAGNVNVVLSVPARVRLLFTAKVLPLARSNVPVEVSMIKPLTLVAVATPKTGVTKVGLVLNTAKPVPVSFVIAASSWALVATSVLLVRLTVLLVSVSVPARVAAVPEAAGPVSVTPLGIVSVPVVVVIVRPYRMLAAVTFLSTPASLMGNSSVPTRGDFAFRPVTVAASRLKANRRLVRMSNEVFMEVGSGFEGVGFLQEIEAIGWDFNEAECDSSGGTCTSGDCHRSRNIGCLRPTVKVQGKHRTAVGCVGK